MYHIKKPSMKQLYNVLFSYIFIVLNLQLFAQEKPTLYLGGGLNLNSGTAGTNTYLNDDYGFHLGGYVPLLRNKTVSFGIHVAGDYSLSSSNGFGQLPQPIDILGQQSSSVYLNAENDINQRSLKVGAGPQLNFNLGKGFSISPILQAGFISFSQDPISFNQDVTLDGGRVSSREIFARDETNSNKFYFTPRVRLSYPITKKLGIWAEGNYTLTKIDQNQRVFVPATEGGAYELGEFMEASLQEENRSASWNTLGFNVGLSLSFGKDRKTQKASSGKQQAAKQNLSKPDGTVLFTNPSKKTAEEQRKLIARSPNNNSNFQNVTEIKQFTWELIGSPIPNAKYAVEVIRLAQNGQAQRTYIGKTDKTSISVRELFADNTLSEGQYRWKVTETTTGLSSTPAFFSLSNCEIQFSITNENVECLGYVGADRKYKICFESTYSSASGDLTYQNATSGLSVYDQTYSPISYTLVNPNPTLVTQIGATASSQQYCFEVTVPASVTAIGFGLQGDDLDPSPILCQPGVSLVLDSLPDCFCNDCEEIELTLNDFAITPNGTTGNQFNFNGNLSANVPVYGISFEVQSYSYTANPSPCSSGVSSVAESGMILVSGTTINGSTNIQAYNEAVSGSPNSNTNATKYVSYSSNTALNGNIPVNLVIGVPGPLPGFDPSCCAIDYEVCIKVRVFYDEGKCGSCVFTHCFQFNNQP